jgi:uncharacterized protein (TIGR02246 family)
MKLDEQALREVHTTWIAAVNAGDLGCLLSLMTDDVVFLSPGREPFGKDGFTGGFLGAHRQYQLNCISELQDVVIVGPGDGMQVAYTLACDSLSITPRGDAEAEGKAGGETKHLAGHRLTVYRKHPDGRWLLARDAHTLSLVD